MANLTEKLLIAFPAFKHRNYQLYFSGQLISQIGSWLQTVAQGWLVLQLTHSAFWVGAIVALNNLPIMFFSLLGGVLVDRFNKKDLLMLTQASFMVLALIQGILTLSHLITLTQLALLAFLTGVVAAIDNPTRQSYVVEMVGKKDLHCAIALNSSVFNGARILGPATAGILIALIGTGGTFILNGISFVAVLIALFFIQTKSVVNSVHPHPFDAIKEGVKYSFSHPIIKVLLIYSAIISIFGWSYSSIMPVIAKQMLHLDAAGLGFLYAASGFGALSASMVVSLLGKKISKAVFIVGGSFLFTISIFFFSFSRNLYQAFPVLFLVGFSLLAQFSTINTVIQQTVKDHLRGRVMSLYTLMFIGLSPFGSLQIGLLAENFGPEIALRIGAFFILLLGAILLFYQERIRIKHQRYVLNLDPSS